MFTVMLAWLAYDCHITGSWHTSVLIYICCPGFAYIACLAPPDMFVSCRSTPVGMGVFGGLAQPVTGGFELGALPS